MCISSNNPDLLFVCNIYDINQNPFTFRLIQDSYFLFQNSPEIFSDVLQIIDAPEP